MKFHNLVLIAFAGGLAAGCSNLSVLVGAVTGASVSPQAASAAVDSSEGLETIATGYMDFCVQSPKTAACVRSTRLQVKNAVVAVRQERDTIVSLLQTANGGPIPVASMNTFKAEIATLQSIITQYNIGTFVAPSTN
jgi:hypothetical protein